VAHYNLALLLPLVPLAEYLIVEVLDYSVLPWFKHKLDLLNYFLFKKMYTTDENISCLIQRY